MRELQSIVDYARFAPTIHPLFLTKPSGMRLVHHGCHPERSEGARAEILRYAQSDTPGWLQRKVCECLVGGWTPLLPLIRLTPQ